MPRSINRTLGVLGVLTLLAALSACASDGGGNSNSASNSAANNTTASSGGGSTRDARVPSESNWAQFIKGVPQGDEITDTTRVERDAVFRQLTNWYQRYPDDLRTRAIQTDNSARLGDSKQAISFTNSVLNDYARLRGSEFLDAWFARDIDRAAIAIDVLVHLAESKRGLTELTNVADQTQVDNYFKLRLRAVDLCKAVSDSDKTSREPMRTKAELLGGLREAIGKLVLEGLKLALNTAPFQAREADAAQRWLDAEAACAPGELDRADAKTLDLALYGVAVVYRDPALREFDRGKIHVTTQRNDEARTMLGSARRRYRAIEKNLTRFQGRHADWTLGEKDLSFCADWLADATSRVAEIDEMLAGIAE